jgi:hypothetical protein
MCPKHPIVSERLSGSSRRPATGGDDQAGIGIRQSRS